MEGRTVEEAVLGERDERRGRVRRELLVERDREGAAVRHDDEAVRLGGSSESSGAWLPPSGFGSGAPTVLHSPSGAVSVSGEAVVAGSGPS